MNQDLRRKLYGQGEKGMEKAFIFNNFSAAMVAEGQWEMAGIEPSEEAFIAANQYLIDSGLAWKLRGFFGRQAMSLVEHGFCHLPEAA